MARPMKPLVRGGGYYPSNGWTPLVYAGGYTTANGGEEPAPPPIEKTITGNPIHITDALAKPAQALSIALEPIQDLNGYDNPWPAGGGKNLLNLIDGTYTYSAGITVQISNGEMKVTGTASASGGRTQRLTDPFVLKAGTYIMSPAPGTPYIRGYLNRASDNSVVGVYSGTAFTTTEDETVYYGINIEADKTYDATIKPQLEAGSTITSWTPYSNICPISGWTGATVTRTGINVWDGVTESGYINVNTGEELSSESQRRSLFVSCKPSTNYVYVNTNAVSGVRIAFYDGAKNYVGMFSNNNSNPQSFTTPQNAKYLRFYWGDTSGISINYPATDTSYHAYQGETYSITFPTSAGTVYGGTLDVTSGKLTVDRAMVDLGTLDWNRRTDKANPFFITGDTPSVKYYNNTNGQVDILCSIYKWANGFRMTSNSSYDMCVNVGSSTMSSSQSLILICDSRFSDAAAFKTAMSGVQLVYELATPQTIQLTPTQVELLLGENNLFSDGEMTLVYLADGNASDEEALNILLGGRYVNNHGEDEPTDREALNIILGGNER